MSMFPNPVGNLWHTARAEAAPRTLSRWEIGAMVVVAVGLHALLWRASQHREVPSEQAPKIPEMVIEFSAPPPPPEPEPIKVPSPAPPEDVDAIKPTPKPRPKPVIAKPVLDKPQPAPVAPPRPTPTPTPAPALPSPPPVTETAAVSSMTSLGNPAPKYPPMALRRGWQGRVVLRIQVLASGRAGTVVVVQSSGHEPLDEAAVTTVKTWKFVPAKRGDIAMDGYASQVIDFTLPH